MYRQTSVSAIQITVADINDVLIPHVDKIVNLVFASSAACPKQGTPPIRPNPCPGPGDCMTAAHDDHVDSVRQIYRANAIQIPQLRPAPVMSNYARTSSTATSRMSFKGYAHPQTPSLGPESLVEVALFGILGVPGLPVLSRCTSSRDRLMKRRAPEYGLCLVSLILLSRKKAPST